MKKVLVSLSFFLFSFLIFSQDIIKPEQSWYTNDKGRLFVNKNLGIYFWASSSADESSKKHLLKSETNKYVNPMHFDTEGYNTFKSPWEVDSSGKYVQPKREVIFQIYADGLAPVIWTSFKGAPKYTKGTTTYYGVGLEVTLHANDAQKGIPASDVSGVNTVYYSINGAAYQQYSTPIKFDTEGEYTLKYYATDNVGNYSEPKSKSFIVDITSPKITQEISGDAQNKVYSPRAKIVLTSTDELSGVKAVYYSIDNKGTYKYYSPIPLTSLKTGNHKFKFWSVDNVKNSNEDAAENGGGTTFDFEYDNIVPTVDFEIVGDSYKSNYTYISSRTKIKLIAKDKNGIDVINYGIDGSADKLYSEAFLMPNKLGVHFFKYKATDKLQNTSTTKQKYVYLDNKAPKSSISYNTPKFFNRDTLFITGATKIYLSAKDYESGTLKIEYSIDNGEFKEYKSAFVIPADGFHTIKYKATDKVNNVEEENISHCFVDNAAPKSDLKFSIQPIGESTIEGKKFAVYPPYVLVFLSATDKNVGAEKIYYSINGSPFMRYYSSSDLDKKHLFKKEGKYEIKVKSVDKLGNANTESYIFYINKK